MRMVTKQSTTKVVMMAVEIFLEDDWGAVVWDAEWDAECEVRVAWEECEVAGVLEGVDAGGGGGGDGAGVVAASRTVYLNIYHIHQSKTGRKAYRRTSARPFRLQHYRPA
jgi:hypothetical protein